MSFATPGSHVPRNGQATFVKNHLHASQKVCKWDNNNTDEDDYSSTPVLLLRINGKTLVIGNVHLQHSDTHHKSKQKGGKDHLNEICNFIRDLPNVTIDGVILGGDF